MRIAEFMQKNDIEMESRKAGRNPSMIDPFAGDHWRCELTCGSNSYVFHFSKGYGHKGKPPRIAEVFECFLSDYSFVDLSFDDFCSELGYDASNKSRISYNVLQQQNKEVENLFVNCFDDFLSLEF